MTDTGLRLGITLDVPQDVVDVGLRIASAFERIAAELERRGANTSGVGRAPPPATTRVAPSAPAPGSGQPAAATEPLPPPVPGAAAGIIPPPALPPWGLGPDLPAIALPPPGVAAPAPAAPVPAAKRSHPKRAVWRNPARLAVLQEHWPRGTVKEEIAALMAPLGGPMPKNGNAIAAWAWSLGLKRSLEFRRAAGAIAGAKHQPVGGWRTEARRSYLREAWTTGVEVRDITAAMNRMDGPTISENHRVAQWAKDLGLARPAGWQSANKSRPLSAPAHAPSPSTPIVAAAPPAPPNRATGQYAPKEGTWRTAERMALLLTSYPAGTEVSVIAEEIAQIAGAPLPENAVQAIRWWANNLGLRQKSAALSPAPVMAPAIPPALRTKDGALSGAALDERAARRSESANAVTWEVAAEWAQRWAPSSLEEEGMEAKLAAINAARTGGFGIPPFSIIASRGPAEPLPHVNAVGAAA